MLFVAYNICELESVLISINMYFIATQISVKNVIYYLQHRSKKSIFLFTNICTTQVLNLLANGQLVEA